MNPDSRSERKSKESRTETRHSAAAPAAAASDDGDDGDNAFTGTSLGPFKPKKLQLAHAVTRPETQFFIPVDDDVAFVKEMTVSALIRGPPACGKSTLAHAVRREASWNPSSKDKRAYVLLPINALVTVIETVENGTAGVQDFVDAIHRLLNSAANLNGALDDVGPNVNDMLTFLVENNVAVLMDEAHVFLRLGKSEKLGAVCTEFLKKEDLMLLFFTTTGEVESDTAVISPPEITKKYFFRGLLPQSVVKGKLRKALRGAGVHFTDPAAALLWELSGCHRGVFTHLVDWALLRVRGAEGREVDEAKLLKKLRDDHNRFTEQQWKSRAVSVNSNARPGFEFLHCLALSNFNAGDHQVPQKVLIDAITRGFIQPIPRVDMPPLSDNFRSYNFLTLETFCAGNVFQTDRYASLLAENEIVMEPLPFNSCADVVLEVLPQLRLLDLLPTVFKEGIPFASHTCMPHEDGWNSELLAKFNAPGNRDATRRRRASPQYSTKKGVGKPDFTWKDTPVGSADKFVYIIESVMWDKDVAKHYDRFRPLPVAVSSSDESQSTDADDTGADDTGAAGTVSEGQVARGKPLKLYHRRKRGETRRALLVIGPDEVAVRNAMNSAASPGDKLFDVDVLGIFPFPGYTAMGFLAAPDAAMAEVPCDNVPRRWCDNAVVVGRKVTSWGHAQNPNAVWVQEQGGDRINIQGLKRPNPPENDIYNLKVAIQDHLGKQGPRNVKRISIFDSVNASSPLPDGTPVTMHTRRAPYMFTVEEGPPPAFADTPPIYVRVYLPGSDKRVTTDVRLRLRSEGLRENVDCLRQILLTIFKLESKGPQHVTVYPQAAKSPMEEAAEALGDVVVITSTLDDTKPYHAVVDGHAPSSS